MLHALALTLPAAAKLRNSDNRTTDTSRWRRIIDETVEPEELEGDGPNTPSYLPDYLQNSEASLPHRMARS